MFQQLLRYKKRINKIIDLCETSLLDEKLCLCGIISSDNDNLGGNFAKVILSSLNGAMLIDNINEKKVNYLRATRLIVEKF